MLAVFTVVGLSSFSSASPRPLPIIFDASTRGLERAPFLLCCYAAISIPITAFVWNVVFVGLVWSPEPGEEPSFLGNQKYY
ncbi:hypothetical protein DFH08DRAFT_897640 [Mycena albidolilacea]|uniref:Uncharacterized protein n=1 Tax=Mycena albidolilacea TaxID=1033008 RepID=A0AAD7ECV4_9AGAR|nr:hypothetical protein DFH08DRAFT_897640 [Mycena albidolilacea]